MKTFRLIGLFKLFVVILSHANSKNLIKQYNLCLKESFNYLK